MNGLTEFMLVNNYCDAKHQQNSGNLQQWIE